MIILFVRNMTLRHGVIGFVVLKEGSAFIWNDVQFWEEPHWK